MKARARAPLLTATPLDGSHCASNAWHYGTLPVLEICKITPQNSSLSPLMSSVGKPDTPSASI